METLRRYFRVERREIAFLRFVFEACDGVAVLRTVDRDRGLVVLHVAPGCEADADTIMAGLGRQMRIEACPPPRNGGMP